MRFRCCFYQEKKYQLTRLFTKKRLFRNQKQREPGTIKHMPLWSGTDKPHNPRDSKKEELSQHTDSTRRISPNHNDTNYGSTKCFWLATWGIFLIHRQGQKRLERLLWNVTIFSLFLLLFRKEEERN